MMNKILTGAVLLLIAGVVGYYFYDKPVQGIDDLKADFELTAIDLVNQYMLDERSADSLYLGKILQVEGQLLQIESGEFTVVTLTGIDISNVRGQLVVGTGTDSFKDKKRITIKGRCAGTLLDVTLNDCIIIK
ncbi:MAG: hypothetical protein JXR03_17490 [Cyclobacteriaceae bacterium]